MVALTLVNGEHTTTINAEAAERGYHSQEENLLRSRPGLSAPCGTRTAEHKTSQVLRAFVVSFD